MMASATHRPREAINNGTSRSPYPSIASRTHLNIGHGGAGVVDQRTNHSVSRNDNLSGNAIRRSGLDPNKFNPRTDFGRGFYVTTSLHQARQWANQRCRPATHLNPEVLEYHLLRDEIESLSHLTFVMDTTDYHEFVEYCRPGQANHGPPPRSIPYDVVYGPVRLWPQRIVLANCDQIPSLTRPSSLIRKARGGISRGRTTHIARQPRAGSSLRRSPSRRSMRKIWIIRRT
jgi:hypothetical protein